MKSSTKINKEDWDGGRLKQTPRAGVKRHLSAAGGTGTSVRNPVQKCLQTAAARRSRLCSEINLSRLSPHPSHFGPFFIALCRFLPPRSVVVFQSINFQVTGFLVDVPVPPAAERWRFTPARGVCLSLPSSQSSLFILSSTKHRTSMRLCYV